MLPVVRGEDETRRQITLYSVLLVAITFLPFAGRLFDGLYAAAAGVLGGVFLWLAVRLQRRPDRRAALRLYLFSLLYLALLFAAMVADVKLYGAHPAPRPIGFAPHGPSPRPQEHPLGADRHGGLRLHVRRLVPGRRDLHLS